MNENNTHFNISKTQACINLFERQHSLYNIHSTVTATYTQRNQISCVDITKTSPKKVKTRRGDNRRRGEGRMGEKEKEEWRRGGGKMGMKGGGGGEGI